VLVEVNWDGQADGNTKERLLCGVADGIRQLIDDRDTAARHGDRQFLLVLPGSDTEQAAQHAERLRQKVEATKYVADGVQWPTTVTCALTDIGCNAVVASVLDMLDEALAEAKRYGGNRTFMHDGLSPTPVVPLDFGLAVQQCAI
jgi:diguanylate cyclase (GGDEF)-like protein